MVAPVEVLRQVPLLAALGEAELEAFAPFLRERRYPRGSMILAQGDSGESLYLIASGQVKVVLIHEDGREVILSVLTEGAFFGEMALRDDEPRSGHAGAMTRAQFLLYQAAFEAFIACSNSGCPASECATAWTDSIRTLLADDPLEQQRAREMAGYYVELLRANGGRSKFCAAAR